MRTRGRADFLELGDWNAACSMCGRKRKASTMVKNWQGQYRCPEHNEERHPQDFVRGIPDVQTVPWSQPETDIDLGGFCDLNGRSAIPGLAIPGCSIPGNVNTLSGSYPNFVAPPPVVPPVLPVLSNPSPSGTIGTSTMAVLSVTTTQGSGTLYGVVDTPANIAGITAAQVKLGQNKNGAPALSAGALGVSSTAPSLVMVGLSASTAYAYAMVQTDSNGTSNLVTGSFTTAASSGGTYPLYLSNIVSGSEKSAQTGYIAPFGFCDNSGNNKQGGQIYPITAPGTYWLRLGPLLGDTGTRTISAATFASANTVAGTNFTAFSGQTVSFGDGEVGEKGIAITILAMPTGAGLVGITLTGNAYRATCWIWLQGSGYAPGAKFVQTSNGTNAHGLTTGAGTSGSPWNSIEYAAAQMGNSGGFLYVKNAGSHKEFTPGVYAGQNPSGRGIQLPQQCSQAAPLIILPDPANSSPLLLDQGVTGVGGSTVMFSNATGFDWNGIQGNNIWICGFNLIHCNYTTYNSSAGCSGLVFWQFEQSYYASDQSNAAGCRIDFTQSIIVQDYYVHNNYSTEGGGSVSNVFDSVPAKTENGIQAFSPANATLAHGLHDLTQYGIYLKDTGVTTSYYITHDLFRRHATTGGNTGGPVAWPEQGGTANLGAMRCCVADATGSPVTQGHMFSCNGGGSSQYQYMDVMNCVQIGNSGLLWDHEIENVRLFNSISQDATLVDIAVNNSSPLQASLEASNRNLFVRGGHGFTVNGVTYPNLAAWQGATLNSFLLSAPDLNSTATNTTPAYGNAATHDYRVAIAGGRGGFYIGVGLERVGCVNNFMNSTLPVAPV